MIYYFFYYLEIINYPNIYLQQLVSNPLGTTISTLGKVSALVQGQMYDAFIDHGGDSAVSIDEQRAAMMSLMHLDERMKDETDSLR
jgi:hypothetical protein